MTSKRIIGDYEFDTNPIGTGSWSVVYKGHHIQQKFAVAIKRIDRKHVNNKTLIKRIITEIEVLKRIDHPNVTRFYDIYKDHQRNLYLVMEYCNGRDLMSVLDVCKKMTENEVLIYLSQIRSGLQYLLEHRILHRDLKPHNILLHYESLEQIQTKKPIVKIADFGLARQTEQDDDLYKTYCGSPMYLAPEVFHGKGYGINSDLWSIGTVMYHMVIGSPPFVSCKTIKKLMEALIDTDCVKVPDEQISPELKSLIESLLIKDPSQRLTWDGFLKHPWFQLNSQSAGSVEPEPEVDITSALTSIQLDLGPISPVAAKPNLGPDAEAKAVEDGRLVINGLDTRIISDYVDKVKMQKKSDATIHGSYRAFPNNSPYTVASIMGISSLPSIPRMIESFTAAMQSTK